MTEDQRLVQFVLSLIPAERSNYYVGRVLGVSEGTVRRWRAGHATRIHHTARERLEEIEAMPEDARARRLRRPAPRRESVAPIDEEFWDRQRLRLLRVLLRDPDMRAEARRILEEE